MAEEKRVVIQSLIEAVNEIASISDYRHTVKKEYCNLARRLKLLTPMFEEIRDSVEALPEESLRALVSLKSALKSAIELLKFGSEGSKIYLVLAMEKVMDKFHEITAQLEQDLSRISYDNLDTSGEVEEQVELVLAQFRRAKDRIDMPDAQLHAQLHDELVSLYQTNNLATDPAVIWRLAEKLYLTGVTDLKQESLSLSEMAIASGDDPGETCEKMLMLLKKIKDFVLTEYPEMDDPDSAQDNNISSSNGIQVSGESNYRSPVIPDDFGCPISLELMKHPVIVSTGQPASFFETSFSSTFFALTVHRWVPYLLLQTYERSCIEKWLEAGHGTCPKTHQTLSSTTLTPNYVLRSLIAQWCEANGLEPPKRFKTSAFSPAERTKIEILLSKLMSGNPEDQRCASGEIRLLAKRNADNRVAIAEDGAIPLLVSLLSTSDSRIQEHAVTALLNLSICEDNKGAIVSSGAVPGIVHVLKKGSMEARENAAATLFSLSVVDGNKVTIGASGAIPPLVVLLSEGTQRGKKDAATALFNLCIYLGNKGKAVRAGVIPVLMRLLTQPGRGMVDEALAILAILAGHPEGKGAIGAAHAVPVLVEVIGTGSPRNKENAAAVLVHLCAGDHRHLVEAKELGVVGALIDLSQNGTDRGKRKAAQLLERMSRFIEQQAQAQAQAESQSQIQTSSHLSISDS